MCFRRWQTNLGIEMTKAAIANQNQQARTTSSALARQTGQKLPSIPAPMSREMDVEISMALNGIVGDERTGIVMFEERRPPDIVLAKLRKRLKDGLGGGLVADYPAEIT